MKENLKEIIYYYRDFLETDFKNTKLPKRRIEGYTKFKNKPVRTCVNSENYSELFCNLFNFIKKIFSKRIDEENNEDKIEISINYYKQNNSKFEEIKKIINEYNLNINKNFIDEITRKSEELKNRLDDESDYEQEFDKNFNTEINNFLEKELNDLFNKIKSINEKYFDGLSEGLIDISYNYIKECIYRQQAFNNKNFLKCLLKVFEDTNESFFNVIKNMKENKKVLFNGEGGEFYLYFYSITINKNTFPLFYIPLDITNKSSVSWVIKSKDKIFINKKAITYIFELTNIKNNSIKERFFNISSDNLDKLNDVLHKIFIEFNQKDFINEILFLNNYNNSNESKKFEFLFNTIPIKISNSIHFVLSDKMDEMILNDYEEILESKKLSKDFENIVEDYLSNDKKENITESINEDFDKKHLSEKLYYESPINLSNEQQKILMALDNKNIKTLIVEGPPGTGKSHTIVSIIAKYIYLNKSVLVLSDKNEALEVIEEKLNNILDFVKEEKDICNPILRLGLKNNNFNNIIKRGNIDLIKEEIEYNDNDDDINKEITTSIKKYEEYQEKICLLKKKENDYGKKLILISLSNLFLHMQTCAIIHSILYDKNLENNIKKRIILFLMNNKNGMEDNINKFFYDEIKQNIEELEICYNNLDGFFKENEKLLSIFYGLENYNNKNYESYKDFLTKICTLNKFKKLLEFKDNKFTKIFLSKIDFASYNKMIEFMDFYYDLSPFYKKLNEIFFIRKKEIKEFDKYFFKKFNMINVSKNFNNLSDIKEFIERIFKDVNNETISDDKALFEIINNYEINKIDIPEKINLIDDFEKIKNSIDKYKLLFDSFENISDIRYLNNILKDIKCILNKFNNDSFLKKLLSLKEFNNKFIEAKKEKIEISNFIKNFKHISIFKSKEKLENISKKDMYFNLLNKTKEMYKNLNSTGQIKITKTQIKKKWSSDFLKIILKNFNCIIASLRDYSSNIPLEKDIFDLIIIDEASQVNVAQAFPTLIRGKKILVLGDKNQFSNVKSSMASIEKSSGYIEKIKNSFKDNPDYYEKAKIFDIRNSVLDFIEESKPGFQIQLKTHFRGYNELISFSNKYFYNNKLQTLKIRKKQLNEIIKFEYVNENNCSIKASLKNTNQAEIDFIIKKLEEYKDKYEKIDKKPSIGIISPHSDQIMLMIKQIDNHKDSEYFYNEFKLKLMTFDTCQGEERDIIFYSMVATEEKDRLTYIFPKYIDKDEEFDDKESNLKRQRLNVGFSRAKEMMYFVLSKDIEKFSGSIKIALRHFYDELNKNDIENEKTDSNSQMEEQIKHYILNTEFYRNNEANILFKCQFPIGEYLKQLDKKYKHPKYVVDFLINIKTKIGDKNIVIEYDGFYYHFKQNANKYNYFLLQNEDDIYRQNILESYGYIFLRLNKFNLGEDPVSFINHELYNLFNKNDFLENKKVENVKTEKVINNKINENNIQDKKDDVDLFTNICENEKTITQIVHVKDIVECLCENNVIKYITIVDEESKPEFNIFNKNTSYGKALLNAKINDIVEVEKPNGSIEELKIINIYVNTIQLPCV